MPPIHRPLILSALVAPFSLAANAALEEVIVTAQKRTQSIQDTPISIAAFTEGQIRQRGITSINDIGGAVPNVKITPTPTNTTAATIAIRGSVTHNPAISWEPTVGVYIDNVYVAKNTGASFDVADIERIEILRGPQGTLYGKNTIGGAVNFITRLPQGDWGGEVRIDVGNYELRTLYTSLDFPSLDLGVGALKTKLTTSQKSRAGFYDNRPDPYGNALAQPVKRSELNDLDREAYRFDAFLEGNAPYTVRYVFDYSYIEQNPSKGQLTHVDVSDTSFGPLPASFADYLTASDRNHGNTSLNRAIREETRNRSHSLFVDLELTDDLALRYIGNAREMTAAEQVDIDGSPLDIFGSEKYIDYQQSSHEIQLSGYTGSTTWVMGLYYFEEEADAAQPIDFFPFLYDDPILGAFYRRQDNRFGFDNSSTAVFGQAEWVPQARWLEERLTLTLGLRWSEEKKRASIDNDGTTPFSARDQERFNNLSPTLIASWAFSYDVSAYIKLAQGWKSGGFNGEAATREAFLSPYDEETVRSLELGLKSMLFDGRVQLNASAFQNVTEDMQQTIFISGAGAQSNVENAGEATVRGFELEIIAKLGEKLRLGLNYGYLDTDYDEFIDTDPSTGLRRDFADEKDFPYAPRHSAGAFVEYTVARGEWGEMSAYLDYQYVDDYVPYVNPNQNRTSQIDAYGLLNGRFTLGNIAVGKFGTLDIALWGKNLTDEGYRLNTVPFGPWTVSYFGDPRTYGLELTYTF